MITKHSFSAIVTGVTLLFFLCLSVVVKADDSLRFIYDGFEYELDDVSELDSTLTFYPVDRVLYEKALSQANGSNKYTVQVPNVKNGYAELNIYEGIINHQTVHANVQVCDTVVSMDEIRDYLSLRITVLDSLKSIFNEMRAKKGKRLTDRRHLELYCVIMNVSASDYNSVLRGAKKSTGEKVLNFLFPNQDDGGKTIKVKVDERFLVKLDLLVKTIDDEVNTLNRISNLDDYVELAKSSDRGYGLLHNLLLRLYDEEVYGRYERLQRKYSYDNLITYSNSWETFKNPLLADTTVTVRNPRYVGAGYAQWKWFEDFSTSSDETEHIVTEYPVKADYYVHKGHPEYIIRYSSGDYRDYAVFDKAGVLKGVKMGEKQARYGDYFKSDAKKAAMLYSFDNNAHDIRSDSDGTVRWVEYLLGGGTSSLESAGGGTFILGFGYVFYQKELKAKLARRIISRKEYYRRLAESKNALKKVAKSEAEAYKNLPSHSKEEEARAKQYLKQLELDFDNMHYVKAERINGIQQMLYYKTEDSTMKILQTYYTENEKVKQSMRVVELSDK